MFNFIKNLFFRKKEYDLFDYKTLSRVTDNLEVYFSPKGGCCEKICELISLASDEILMQAYAFTSEPIAEKLIKAKKRKVNVSLILDSDQVRARCSQISLLKKNGIECFLDGKHPISHNKIIIIDRKTIISGSYNFSNQAESNAENLIIIRDNKEICDTYLVNFLIHKSHSAIY